MAEREVEKWITVNGKHVPVYKGESSQDAFNRATVKQAEDKKARDIARNQEAANKASGKASSLAKSSEEAPDGYKTFSDKDLEKDLGEFFETTKYWKDEDWTKYIESKFSKNTKAEWNDEQLKWLRDSWVDPKMSDTERAVLAYGDGRWAPIGRLRIKDGNLEVTESSRPSENDWLSSYIIASLGDARHL